jgi:hypothetical protein
MSGVSVKTYDFNIPAGGAYQIMAMGTFFRLRTCTAPISVTGDFGEVSSLIAGQGLKDAPFTQLQLKNPWPYAVSGTVIVASQEFVDMSSTVSISNGTINVAPNKGVITTSSILRNTQSAQGWFLDLPVNPSRKYLRIKSLTAAGFSIGTPNPNNANTTLSLSFDNGATSFQIDLGEVREFTTFVPTAQIHVLTSVAQSVFQLRYDEGY